MTQPAPPQSTRKVDAGRIKGAAAVPNCVEIIVPWSTGTAPARSFVSVLHGANPNNTPINVGLAQTLTTSFHSAFTANLAIFQPTASFMGNVGVRDMTNVTNPPIFATGGGAFGTSVSIAMPFDAAIVLTENLVIRGRGQKGRIFLPNWATNADAGGGVIDAAVVTAVTTFGTAIFNAITAAALTPAVAKVARAEYLGVTGAHHLARGASAVNVLNYTCRDNRWDSQRRRNSP